jgi:hypothetical protein
MTGADEARDEAAKKSRREGDMGQTKPAASSPMENPVSPYQGNLAVHNSQADGIHDQPGRIEALPAGRYPPCCHPIHSAMTDLDRGSRHFTSSLVAGAAVR